MGRAAQPLEFGRKLALAEVPPGGRDWVLEATPDECAALARRLDLPKLHRLSARLRVIPHGDGARVEGGFEADLRQTCVVSLEPFEVRLCGQIRQSYSRVAVDAAPSGPVSDPWCEDVPEPLQEGAMDLGDLVVQYLALAIDPYPRGPGAGGDALPREGSGRDGPFAALKALKRGKP